jgi:glycosyltransferase involved in cell wall biosynthesis
MTLIVTDTYEQVNGVSTTYKNMVIQSDYTIAVLHPGMFKYTSARLYPEVQICTQPLEVWKTLKKLQPPSMHIATEGVLGIVARHYCRHYKIPYTTAYHTKFPEFLKEIAHVPEFITYAFLRWFHKGSKAILTTTKTMCQELTEHGFKNAVSWTRGVNLEELGEGRVTSNLSHATKPLLLSVGRVSKEKNLDVFCQLNKNKYRLRMVGDGPYLEELKAKYPWVEFAGYKHGKELGQEYADADCMVFTSHTDTFGLVMIESMCMGTPVAAFKVTGPTDAIHLGQTGYYNKNLNRAITDALDLDRELVMHHARQEWSWANAYKIFHHYTK